jgi:hypothetical protein
MRIYLRKIDAVPAAGGLMAIKVEAKEGKLPPHASLGVRR